MILTDLYLAAAQVQGDVVEYVPHEVKYLEVFGRMMPMFAILFLIFYVWVIKPQNQKNDALKELLGSLKKGDMIVTESGIIGRVAGIEKEYILLEISNNTRVKFELSQISKRWEPNAKREKAA